MEMKNSFSDKFKLKVDGGSAGKQFPQDLLILAQLQKKFISN